MFNRYKNLISVFVLLIITAIGCRFILANMPVIYGDIPYFNVSLSKVNSFYIWGPEQFGTSVRQGLNTIRDIVIVYLSPNDYIFYFLKHVLPIFIMPIAYYLILSKLKIKNASIKLIVSLLSLINPIFFGDFLTGQTVWVHIPLPFVVLYAIKIYYYKEFNLKNTILFVISLFLTFGMLPPIIIPLCLIISLLIILIFIQTVIAKKMTTKLLISYVIYSFVTLILFSLLTLPYTLMASSGQKAYAPISLLGDYQNNYKSTILTNSLRLAGNNGNGQTTLKYNISSTPNLFGYVLMSIILLAFVITKNNKKQNYPLLEILIIILLVLGFLHILAINKEIGFAFFKSQWLASTIRNPAKLYVTLLPFFIFAIAFSIDIILQSTNKKASNTIIFVCLLSMLIYGWPFIRGDFGLIYNKNPDNFKKDETIQTIAKLSPNATDRTILVPANHKDELNYQHTSLGMNTLRLQGGMPNTAEVTKNLISSFNTKNIYFTTYLDILGIKNVILKNDISTEKSNQFGLFPLRISHTEANDFLVSNTNDKKIYDNFTQFINEDAVPLIYSPQNINLIKNNNSFKLTTPLLSTNSAVINEEKQNFEQLYSIYNQKNSLENNEFVDFGYAILNNPQRILIEYYFEKDNNNLVLTIINPMTLIPEATYNYEITTEPSLIKFSNKFQILDEKKRKIYVNSGKVDIATFSFEEIDISAIDPSFESQILQVGDATINKEGKAEIYAKYINEPTDGNRSLLIGSKNHTAYITKKLPINKKFTDFVLTFDYKYLKGLQPSFSIIENNTMLKSFDSKLSDEKSWSKVSEYFSTESDAVDLYLYVNSAVGQTSESLFDNLKLSGLNITSNHSIDIKPYDNHFQLSNYIYNKSLVDVDYSSNLITNSSFEDPTLWGEVNDGSISAPGKADFNLQQSTDAFDGNNSVHLESNNHTAYISQKIKEFDPNVVYNLSFKYKNVSGKQPSFAIWQNGISEILVTDQLDNSLINEWNTYETTFAPQEGATGLTLYFYSKSSGEQTINLFDNVEIKAAPVISNYLIKEKKNIIQPGNIIATYERLSPTKLKLKMKPGSGIVIFNESFHQGWRAYIESEYKTQPNFLQKLFNNHSENNIDNNHVMVNGFANGWLINSNEFRHLSNYDGSYDLILEFWPQRQFFITLTLSGTIFSLCIIYILYTKIKHKPKKINKLREKN